MSQLAIESSSAASEPAIDVHDLSIGYAITPNLTLNFDAINLTKERYEAGRYLRHL